MSYCLIYYNAFFVAGEITSTRESVAVIFDACVDENYALVGFFEGDAARIWSEKTEQVIISPFLFSLVF